jgi:hypothetical protein
MENQNFSLLRACDVRPYWQALAHCIVAAKPASARMAFLNQQFIHHLSVMDKLRCRAEIRQCQKAKRGELEAILSRGDMP